MFFLYQKSKTVVIFNHDLKFSADAGITFLNRHHKNTGEECLPSEQTFLYCFPQIRKLIFMKTARDCEDQSHFQNGVKERIKDGRQIGATAVYLEL